jgi:predicted secreted protein
MKTKTSILIIGLVTIAAVAAGTVLGVSLTSEKPVNVQKPTTHYLTVVDENATFSLKKGDILNLTLRDYGDGGYVWTITQVDDMLLHQTAQFTWGSSGMLGDFGKDTWVFSAVHTGITTLSLECARSFGDHEVCQQFIVHINIV